MGLSKNTFVLLTLTFANAAMAIDIESDAFEVAKVTKSNKRGKNNWVNW